MIPFIAIILCIIIFFYFKWKQKGQRTARKEKENYKAYLAQFDTPKDAAKLEPIYTKIAGVQYKNDDTKQERQKLIEDAKVGDFLMLVPQATNMHDSDAVRVFRLNGDQLGFLNTDLAMEINSRLSKKVKVEAKITAISGEGNEKEVHIEIQKYSRKKKH